jgi:hypothetical protein
MKFTRISSVSGIIVFILGTAGYLLLGFLKPGYDPLVSTISELGENGGINSETARITFIITGCFEIIVAAGLFLKLKERISGALISISVATKGLFDSIGSGIFPCDYGGLYNSFSGKVHFMVSIIGVAVIIIIPFFFYQISSKNDCFDLKIASISRIAITIAAIIFTISFFSGVLIGLTQRILYYIYLLILLYIVIKLPSENLKSKKI